MINHIECFAALHSHFGHNINGYRCYAFGKHESDFLTVTSAGYIHEIEIKMSRSDFLADFKKQDKHTRLQHGEYANYFWFAVPQGLLLPADIPDYAGHLEFIRLTGKRSTGLIINQPKKAPRLHTNKMPEIERKILLSMHYKQLNYLQQKASEIRRERA